MAPIVPNPAKIKSFRTEAAFESWLRRNHARETELWLQIYKKDSGVPTITSVQALDVVLCWGWIDGIRKAFDERSFLQRYTPRRPRSVWSQINRDHVARLTAAGRMTPHGQRQVDAAKADGRWDAAYDSWKNATESPELKQALAKNRKAAAFFATLDSRNRYAIIFRLQTAARPETKAKRLKQFVDMLARNEKLYP